MLFRQWLLTTIDIADKMRYSRRHNFAPSFPLCFVTFLPTVHYRSDLVNECPFHLVFFSITLLHINFFYVFLYAPLIKIQREFLQPTNTVESL